MNDIICSVHKIPMRQLFTSAYCSRCETGDPQPGEKWYDQFGLDAAVPYHVTIRSVKDGTVEFETGGYLYSAPTSDFLSVYIPQEQYDAMRKTP